MNKTRIEIGITLNLASILGHKVQVARNLYGHILIIDGIDREYGLSSIEEARNEARRLLNPMNLNLSGAGDERGSSYTNPHVV
jgi:hypothetical protein